MSASSTPPIPGDRYDLRVLQAIRRLMRAADLHSRRLSGEYGVTVPQIVCLNRIAEQGELTVKALAGKVFLSPSTVVGVLDRLEARDLVRRRRSETDKRIVHVGITTAGRELLAASPSPLHEELVSGFRGLSETQQKRIAASLEQLVDLLEIGRMDAAPILAPVDPPDPPASA